MTKVRGVKEQGKKEQSMESAKYTVEAMDMPSVPLGTTEMLLKLEPFPPSSLLMFLFMDIANEKSCVHFYRESTSPLVTCHTKLILMHWYMLSAHCEKKDMGCKVLGDKTILGSQASC